MAVGEVGRIHHAVSGRWNHSVGESLEHVSRIHHDLARRGLHGEPMAVRSQYFKPGFARFTEKCNQVDILVWS